MVGFGTCKLCARRQTAGRLVRLRVTLVVEGQEMPAGASVCGHHKTYVAREELVRFFPWLSKEHGEMIRLSALKRIYGHRDRINPEIGS